MEAFFPNTSLLLNELRKPNDLHEVGLDQYLGTSIRESTKIAHLIYRAAKHIKISCLSRESSYKAVQDFDEYFQKQFHLVCRVLDF